MSYRSIKMPMYNAVHPGRILRNWMGDDVTVSKLAEHLGITRPQVSNIVNGKAGISTAMAIKLAASFPQTDAQFWVNLQSNYELSCALKEKP
jgi:addiction module HigA family antidote